MSEPAPPFDYYRDAPLIRQVANDVRNGIASPLAVALLESLANFAEQAQAGFYDVVVDALSQRPSRTAAQPQSGSPTGGSK